MPPKPAAGLTPLDRSAQLAVTSRPREAWRRDQYEAVRPRLLRLAAERTGESTAPAQRTTRGVHLLLRAKAGTRSKQRLWHLQSWHKRQAPGAGLDMLGFSYGRSQLAEQFWDYTWSRQTMTRASCCCLPQNHRILGQKKPLRSSPTIRPTTLCLLSHIPKCHIYTFFWTPPGMGTLPPPWAACSNVWPLFQ